MTSRVVAETTQRPSEALLDPTPVFVRGPYGRRLTSEVPEAPIPVVRLKLHLPPVGLSLADLPEAEIIARAVAHDTLASTELQWRSYTRVLMLLSDRLGSRASAQELVPQVMDAMLLALPALPPQADFSRWLAGFVAGTALDL